MATLRLTKHNTAMLISAFTLVNAISADAIVLLLEGATDWQRLAELMGKHEFEKPLVVAVDSIEELDGAAEAGLKPVALNKEKAPLLERLQHALLEAAADEFIKPNDEIVAIYGGFTSGRLDSISHLKLDERMRRLTTRDLQSLESSVPLKTLKVVVDLGVQIGVEGREGKPVGALFVVGDTRSVLKHASDSGVDPFRGYNKKSRNLFDARVQEDAKELSQLDGAFLINADGTIERSRQMLEVLHEDLNMSKGLGSRHWAAAAITRRTKAVAIVVSQSTGTVRLYQNGFLKMQIEPMDKGIKWQEISFKPPSASGDD
ncbi:DNA integrity scanning protein DisA nucleotide-binding domain protein [Stieleria sp. ICT_E10.1]|uniref:DNA integrity scanning protein DisA nucleotide-binding domain protein n=1 Tax=Stieleria sedimenti TaxID=2976331 RepID=UPI00217F7BA0|nr:DNA integrity scanning protein DisA nucleotide-binding domain protein [Stieleria sedimenti]MCS7468248.1 DNA integrity scanning protein DisA nucleotide-binding domain protein [Stieleria sedimenti]